MKKTLAALVLSAAALTAAAVPAAAASGPFPSPAPAGPSPMAFVTAKQCAAGGGKVVSGATMMMVMSQCKGGKSDGAWVVPDFAGL